MMNRRLIYFAFTLCSFVAGSLLMVKGAYAANTFLQGRIWRDSNEDYRRVDTTEALLSGASAPQVLISYNCSTSAGPVGGNAVTNTTLCSSEGTGSYTTPLNTPLIKENITSCIVIAGLSTPGWYFTQNKGHATWASSVCTFGSTQGNDYTGVCAATDPANGRCTRLRVTVPGADIQGTAGFFYLWFGVNMIAPTGTPAVTPTPTPSPISPTPISTMTPTPTATPAVTVTEVPSPTATTSVCPSAAPASLSLTAPTNGGTIGSATSAILEWNVTDWGHGGVDQIPATATICDESKSFEVYVSENQADVFDPGNYKGTVISSVSTFDFSAEALMGHTYFWGIRAINVPLRTDSAVHSFRLDNTINEWFITYTGDVHSDGDIINDRPAQTAGGTLCSTTTYPAFMSMINDTASPAWDAGAMSGIVSYRRSFTGGCVLTDPAGAVSKAVSINAQAETSIPEQQRTYGTATTLNEVKSEKLYYGYDYYVNHIPADLFAPTSSSTAINAGDIAGRTFFKFAPPPGSLLHIQTLTISPGEKKIILLDGSATIEGAITVAPGGFFALIARSNISINPTVAGTANSPALQGIYIADGVIYTGTNNAFIGTVRTSDAKNCNSQAAEIDALKDTTLFAAGTFAAWGGVVLERQLSPVCRQEPGHVLVKFNTNHIESPSEVFVYRPDFLLYAPKEFMDRPYLFTEIKP